MNIREITLASNDLTAQYDFYTSLLEQEPICVHDRQLSFQIGATVLSFKKADALLPGKYHFAFNIPEHQFDQAAMWIRHSVDLLRDQSGEELFYSERWDAHMLYFSDAEGNILELIARHSLVHTHTEAFNGKSLLNMSEIGIAADDVIGQARALEQIGILPYQWSGGDTFLPAGDEHGLLICVKPGRIWFPDTGIAATHMPVSAIVEVQGQRHSLRFGEHAGW